jgi:threonyl-tRNA synthetase
MFLLEKDQSLKGCAANSDSANSPQFALKPMNCPGCYNLLFASIAYLLRVYNAREKK